MSELEIDKFASKPVQRLLYFHYRLLTALVITLEGSQKFNPIIVIAVFVLK